jgi:hypothetical protein
MARDHPDVLERVKQGKFRSVHAAAVEIGIAPRTLHLRATAESLAAGTHRYLHPAEIHKLITYLRHPELLPDPQKRPGPRPLPFTPPDARVATHAGTPG